MRWRLVLDPPMSFVTESGFRKSQTCKGFVEKASSNMIRDAATGLLMLKPAHLSPDLLRASIIPFTQWEKVENRWIETARGHGPRETGTDRVFPFAQLTPRKATSEDRRGIMLPGVNRAWPLEGALTDVSYWIARSKILLAEDQGLWIFVEPLSDPTFAPENFFGISWATVLVAVRKRRLVEVYACSKDDPMGLEKWKLVAAASMAEHLSPLPESFALTLIPIPGRGLSVTVTGFKSIVTLSRSEQGPVGSFSFLAPLPSVRSGSTFRMLAQSRVFIRGNPFTPFSFSSLFVTYVPSGFFTDLPFVLPYAASVQPTKKEVRGYVAGALGNRMSVSVDVLDGEGENAWTPGSMEASAKLSLATEDNRYSPFIHSYSLEWPSVTSSRQPWQTVISDSQIQSLEFADDLDGRCGGSAKVILQKTDSSFAKMTQGQFVYFLQNRASEEEQWQNYGAGLGRTGRVSKLSSDGFYEIDLELLGMHAKLAEVHVATEGGFDGLSVAEAVNRILTGAGFAPIQLSSFPLPMRQTFVPLPEGTERFKWAPTQGQSGLDALDCILRLVETQSRRYRLRFTNSGWVAEAVPLGTIPKTIFFSSRGDAYTWVKSVDFQVFPPEANVVIVMGGTETDYGGERLVAHYVNQASISNPSSPDYLGWQRVVIAVMPELQTKEQVAFVLRQFERRVAHRLVRAHIRVPLLNLPDAWIAPGELVRLYDPDYEEPVPVPFYVLRRTLRVSEKYMEVDYSLSSEWWDVEDQRT